MGSYGDLNSELGDEEKASASHLNNADNSTLHLLAQKKDFYKKSSQLIQIKFKNYIDELDKFIKLEIQKSATASKIKALKECSPKYARFDAKLFQAEKMDMAKASEIQTLIADIVTNAINNTLKQEHQTRFELATVNLNSNLGWKVIIGAILGAVAAIIAISALMLSGIGISFGADIGGFVAGVTVGGGLGDLASKNPIKKINSSAQHVLFYKGDIL